MTPPSTTAQEAKEMAITANGKADLALQKHNDHEKVCAERYQGIRDDIKSVKDGIDSMKSRAVTSAFSLIIGLVALVGFLLQDKFFQ